MTAAFVLVIALVLDALLGEPKWLWDRARHPAVLMGQLVSYLDETLNRPRKRKAKGVLTVAILVTVGAVVGGLLSAFGPFVEILVVAVLIAQRSLVDHVNDVARGLESSVIEGRHAVSMIVSRDTDMMTGPQVARSAIESGSENFSDGVVAPAFWFLVAGLPGLVIYKMVNTADSMIGYRNDRYESFGWAAARLDDVLNWIPARLTGLLIALVGGQLRQWSDIMIDAGKHRSPNAGWPEAAMARTLGLSLAGPRSYDGQMRHFAWVNETGAKGIGAHAIRRCTDKLWQAWAAGLGLTVAFALVF